MTANDLGNLIRLRRESFHLRQEDLAGMCGITVKTIHLIEAGTGNPAMGTLQKIATVLGMELVMQVKMINSQEA